MLEFQCPHCREVLHIPEQFLGMKGTCRKCHRPIVVEQSATHDSANEDKDAFFRDLPPTLVAFHLVATGPSARKSNIAELAGVKFDLEGSELDTFFSYANPGHMILPRITEKTGLTDEMVADAPPSLDVVKMFFEWIGPHVTLFSHHAHADSKFLCGALLKDDLQPPPTRVVDVLQWARHLEVPIEDISLTSLVDFMGERITRHGRRTQEASHAIAKITNFLIRRQIGTTGEGGGGIMDSILGKKQETVNHAQAYKSIRQTSHSLEHACGSEFFEKMQRAVAKEQSRKKGMGMAGAAAAKNKNLHHPPEWYQDRHVQIEMNRRQPNDPSDNSLAGTPSWEFRILEATQTDDADERRNLCEQAVDEGAIDPWPYERLMAVYIKAKDYDSAFRVSEAYFASNTWKFAKWAEKSLEILKRMEKLDRKLKEQAGLPT